MILAILFALLGYLKAKKTGRSKAFWSVAMALIYLFVQFVILVIGVVGIGSFGWDPALFVTYEWTVNIGGWILGAVICLVVLSFLRGQPLPEPVDPSGLNSDDE